MAPDTDLRTHINESLEYLDRVATELKAMLRNVPDEETTVDTNALLAVMLDLHNFASTEDRSLMLREPSAHPGEDALLVGYRARIVGLQGVLFEYFASSTRSLARTFEVVDDLLEIRGRI